MKINDPEILREVEAAFARYEAALISNDVAVLDALFWSDDRTVRFGATENLYGHAEILAFRQARPSKNLDRELRNTVITTFGDNTASATSEFVRPGETRIGRQSQTWVRVEGNWRIVAAHVSWMV
ncbi:MAG: oxalurate catabolism protein HpxZ [Pseudomonadota bacterium]